MERINCGTGSTERPFSHQYLGPCRNLQEPAALALTEPRLKGEVSIRRLRPTEADEKHRIVVSEPRLEGAAAASPGTDPHLFFNRAAFKLIFSAPCRTTQFEIMERQVNMRLAIGLGLAVSLLAQDSGVSPTFDAASLKRSAPGVSGADLYSICPAASIYAHCRSCLSLAELGASTRSEIVASDWMRKQPEALPRHTQAHASAPLSDEQMKPMLQSLLIERLQMKTHFEERKTQVYAALFRAKAPSRWRHRRLKNHPVRQPTRPVLASGANRWVCLPGGSANRQAWTARWLI